MVATKRYTGPRVLSSLVAGLKTRRDAGSNGFTPTGRDPIGIYGFDPGPDVEDSDVLVFFEIRGGQEWAAVGAAGSRTLEDSFVLRGYLWIAGDGSDSTAWEDVLTVTADAADELLDVVLDDRETFVPSGTQIRRVVFESIDTAQRLIPGIGIVGITPFEVRFEVRVVGDD